MDNNFQTSFIPKKPMTIEASETGSGVNIFLLISIFIFIIAVIASAGVYLYQASLVQGLKDRVDRLAILQKDDPTTLENIIAFDRQLNLADKLLSQHVAVSPIFAYLGENTAQDVRFKSLIFSYTDPSKVSLKMSGVAKNFNAIAGQSDAFKKSSYSGIINPIFSDFVPTPTGTVSFNLTADLDSDLVNYKAQKEKVSGSAASGGNQTPSQDQTSTNFGN